MRGSTNSTVDKDVFAVAVVISVAFLLWGVLAKDNLAGVTSAVLDYVVANFTWMFVLASFGFLVFAASLVMGMLSSRGNLRPSKTVVVVWGVLTGAAAVALLAEGLDGLQTAAILSAAPFVLVMIGLCFFVCEALRGERLPETRPSPGAAPEPGRAPTRPSGVPAPQQARAVNPNTKK